MNRPEIRKFLKNMINSDSADQKVVAEHILDGVDDADADLKQLIASAEEMKASCRAIINRLEIHLNEDPHTPVKCLVACHNASGEPDLFFVIVECTEQEQAEGCHYDAAKRAALDMGYENPMVPFDETDNAGRAMLGHFEWKTATLVRVSEEDRR